MLDLGLEGCREVGGPLHDGVEFRIEHDRDVTLVCRGGNGPGPAAGEALHEGVVAVDVGPPVLAAIPAHDRERGRRGLEDPVAAREHPRPARAVQHPLRLDLGASGVLEHDLDPPPLPVAGPLRQPGHPPHDGRSGLLRRLTQEPVEARPQDVEPGGVPREVVTAALAAPKRRVPGVGVEPARLHHPEQTRRGKHLARAGGQGLGKGLVAPGCGALDHHHVVAPGRQQSCCRRARGTTAEDEDVWVRVHALMCRHLPKECDGAGGRAREPRVSKLDTATPI